MIQVWVLLVLLIRRIPQLHVGSSRHISDTSSSDAGGTDTQSLKMPVINLLQQLLQNYQGIVCSCHCGAHFKALVADFWQDHYSPEQCLGALKEISDWGWVPGDIGAFRTTPGSPTVLTRVFNGCNKFITSFRRHYSFFYSNSQDNSSTDINI